MSSETLHFDKAPIVEAVIGVDLEEMLGEDSLVALKELGQRLRESYPTCEDLKMSQFELTIGSQPKQMDTQIGYFFKSIDQLNVVHARRNGFAFSRLAPYQNWGVFFAEARHSWKQYREVIGPIKLAKWTVRYLNKLSWPAGEPMEDYLRVYPYIPEDLPQMIGGCYMRLQIPIESPQGLLTQQLVMLPQEQPDKSYFMLDNEFTFSAIGLSDSTVWEHINLSREIKNKFFVNSITDKLKEMIS
jgi:uncharacterized protein (TIGR04255 family)